MFDVLKDKKVLTRKPHRCFGCGRGFSKGTTLRFVVTADCGEMSNSYWCPVCDRIMNKHPDDYIDGTSFGDILFNDPDEFEKVREEVEGSIRKDDWRNAPSDVYKRISANAVLASVKMDQEAYTRLKDKCNWERMTPVSVLLEWGDPREWE